jgi:MFS family permease
MRQIARSRALLSDPRFRSLWLSQGIAQTAQNALLFALLVVVLDITGSSIHTSLLVLCFILPSIPLGFAVGVLLDRFDKRPVLILTNLVRAGACVLFYFFHQDVWVVYTISIVVATAGLFFNPAVVALIPSMVPRDKLVPANSLYNFTLTVSQLVGIVFIAPVLLKSVGPDGMFIAGAMLYLAAAVFGAQVGSVHTPTDRRSLSESFTSMPTEFRDSWRALSSDKIALLAISQLIVSSTLVLLFAILIPRYMGEVLEVPADSAALVFAPAGIGALVGLRFVPWFSRKSKNHAVVVGLAGIAVCMALLALVEPIAELWKSAPEALDPSRLLRVSLLQALVMLFAAPMGFFYALLNAPAQTVLHERAPADMRGRIFATQVISANFISLLPLLMVGVVTDLVGITPVLLMLSLGLGVLAFVSHTVGSAPKPPPSWAESRESQGVGV